MKGLLRLFSNNKPGKIFQFNDDDNIVYIILANGKNVSMNCNTDRHFSRNQHVLFKQTKTMKHVEITDNKGTQRISNLSDPVSTHLH